MIPFFPSFSNRWHFGHGEQTTELVMGKPIFIFIDGSGKRETNRTNVHQLYEALDVEHKFYDRGVGSRRVGIAGKAFGLGLAKRIRRGYRHLVEHYEPGDQVYLLGFSRGAYAVRSLANLVGHCGLVERAAAKELKRNIDLAYQLYRKNRSSSFDGSRARLQERAGLRELPIEFIGVWDTVGAVGRPTLARKAEKQTAHRYHRMTLHPGVRRAFHAVSIDDERAQFWPHLWDEEQAAPGQEIEQVWFPGVHSDVGGGYRDARALSNISLRWMIGKLPHRRLGLTGFMNSLEIDACAPMHDSRRKRLRRLYVRKVREVPAGSRIHKSAVIRMRGPLAEPLPACEPEGVYRPQALVAAEFETPPHFGIRANYRVV